MTQCSQIKRLATGVTLALVIVGCCFWWLGVRRPQKPAIQPAPAYVADQSCRSCHRTIYDSYRRTAMGRAWYPPTPDNIIEDYTDNNHVYDSQRDLHYESIARGSEFFQREYRLDEQGAVTHELVRQVKYIVGSGDHVRSYVAETNGFLTQMPISWYSAERKWDLSPGYKEFNHRFDRPMGPGCVGCHTSYPRHVEGTNNRFGSPVPSGIGCERCHGPAEWHVRQKTEAWQPPRRAGATQTIVNPARLSADRTDDVCFQCHLQGEVQFAYPDQNQYDFRPGLRLQDYRSDFVAETSDPDKFGIASHATRVVLSRCYQSSAGQFHCVTCHDPHIPLREVPAESYRQACLSCHGPQSCNRVPDSSVEDQKNDCVACHMPRDEPSDVQHALYTDHWIRRRQADRSEPEQERRRSEFVSMRDFWRDTRFKEEREGIAHIAFGLSKGGRANLEYGIDLLRKAAASGTLHRDGWRKVGTAALVKQDPRLAGFAFERALERDPSDSRSRLGLGSAFHLHGDLDEALTQLEQVIRIMPDQLEAYFEAAGIYVERQQPRSAIALLEESIRRYPYQPMVFAALGTLYCQGPGDPAQGIDAYRRAIELDPDNTAIRISLGSAYMSQHEMDSAREQFQQVLRTSPDCVPALLATARLHSLLDEKPQAIEQLRHVLRLDPANEHAVNLLRELGAPQDSNSSSEHERGQ